MGQAGGRGHPFEPGSGGPAYKQAFQGEDRVDASTVVVRRPKKSTIDEPFGFESSARRGQTIYLLSR